MKVIIEQRHTINTTFKDCKDCALNRAIKEQHPNFKLNAVGGSFLKEEGGKHYDFNCSYEDGWGYKRFHELKEGKINQYILDISIPHYDNPSIHSPLPTNVEQPKEKIREVIRYVGVPETVKTQSKELITFNN